MPIKEMHSHSHSRTPDNLNFAFAVGIIFNIAMAIAQIGFGVFAHFVALLANAGHDFQLQFK